MDQILVLEAGDSLYFESDISHAFRSLGEEPAQALIVVYHNRRREINEVFSGSCSQRVSDHANCSVLRLRNVLA